MNATLLDSVDGPGLLRELAFGLLVRDRRPIEINDLASAAGLDLEVAATAVASLAKGGRFDLDEAGRVTGSAGLSLATGPHSLTLGQAQFRTWCAYDALGIATALEANAVVETACGVCRVPIVLSFRTGKPDRSGPERLWLAKAGDDLRGSFCTPTVLLCDEAHGALWAERQDGHGRQLDLEEGARLGGAEWASCAAAARRLT